jgi:hypothetical protein
VKQPVETTTHFPFYLHPHVRDAYTKKVEEFKSWMDETHTDPEIAHYFYQALLQKALPTDDLPLAVYQASDQSKIGWDIMLFGRLGITRTSLHSEHCKAIKFRRSPERWSADMVYRLLRLNKSYMNGTRRASYYRKGSPNARKSWNVWVEESERYYPGTTTCSRTDRRVYRLL